MGRRPVSSHIYRIALVPTKLMFTDAELPDARGNYTFPPLARDMSNLGARSAMALKCLFSDLRMRSETNFGAFVTKLVAADLSAFAFIFLNRPAVLAPQGKALGATLVLDISYFIIPALPSKSTSSTATRAQVKKFRCLADNAEAAYRRLQRTQVPAIGQLGDHFDAIVEYLEFGHAATVDHSIPDANLYPMRIPATAAAFAVLKPEFKRSILFPLFPTA
ncbi:hypothetical protein H9P43_005140 [Blastocladiella emersonii ATCC 22665]|nr:hypothetical protein H9P43_005140 [Blastocladiella emersonii ATCC 22665]